MRVPGWFGAFALPPAPTRAARTARLEPARRQRARRKPPRIDQKGREDSVAHAYASVAGAPAADVDRALDPGVTGADLLPLAVHHDARVRAAVAWRTDCPAGALISLAHDSRSEVLMSVLANPRTPSGVVRTLAGHPEHSVADAALQRLRSIYRQAATAG